MVREQASREWSKGLRVSKLLEAFGNWGRGSLPILGYLGQPKDDGSFSSKSLKSFKWPFLLGLA